MIVAVLGGEFHFPLARLVDFAAYNNRFAGRSCHVVGRGRTAFNYDRLGDSDDPVLFINDAVCLEKHVRGESFFFAHDPQLLSWLDGSIRSTAVLPIDGKLFRSSPKLQLQHRGQVIFYRWREQQREQLLTMTRDELAAVQALYTHTGTIHSLLHFAWFCGFKRVRFVGCDGEAATGYDPRLENRSASAVSSTYPMIRHVQGLLCQLFGFETEYLGGP
jgi:hypothetical protein